MALVAAACGGRSARQGNDASQGGAGGSEAGGASAGMSAGSAPLSGGNSSSAAGSGGDTDTGGASAGSASAGAPSAGQGGVAGQSAGGNGGNGGAPVLDRSRARFPIPNSVYSGLPHPVSYDKSAPGLVHDNVTGLTWQESIGLPPVPLKDGLAYCDSLSLGGKDDWRLPTRIELVTLMAAVEDITQYDGTFPMTLQPGGFWTASAVIGDIDMSPWIVYMAYDFNYSATSKPQNVRCVRSDDAVSADPAPSGFVVMGDVVKDTGTGLTWERSPPMVWRTRADSFAYCKNLTLGGIATGWRLSSMPELLTLLGLQTQPPHIDALVFPDVDSVTYGWFWTTTVSRIPDELGRELIPSVNLGYLERTVQYDEQSWLVRCVHD